MKRTGNSKLAVVGWGRGMGHSGHMYLADAVITQAKDMKADPYFFVSKTVGKDDPLLPEEKLAIYQTVFPQQKNIFTAEGNLNQALQELAKLGYQGVVLVVGADQKESFKYLEKPNKEGVPVYQSFGFSKLKVISRQETRSKFRGEEGPRATPMRQALLDPNMSDEEKYQVWRRDMPSALSDEQVADLMKKAQSRLLGATKKKQVAENRIMDRNALINAYYVSTKGDRHRVAERIPYYLLDKLVGLLTKKYNITMHDIEVRPADKNQYRRTSQPELAEGVQCTPSEVAELLYNAKPEVFTKFGDEFVMNAIEQACEQHQGSVQEVAGKAVDILKQGIQEGLGDTIAKKAKQFGRYMTEPNSPHNAQVRSRAKNIDMIRKKEALKSVFEKDPEAKREFERAGGYEAGIDVMGWQVGWAAARLAKGDTMKQAFQKLYYGGGSSFPFSERAFKLAWVAYNKHYGPEAAIEEGFDKEEFRRHMKDLEAREELRKTDPVAAKALDLRGQLPQQSKKKPEDDSMSINDPRHPGYSYTEIGHHKVDEGDVVQFPKKHRGDITDMHSCPKCGGDTQGGKYMGHQVQVCMPCKQVYLPPNSGIDQQGNKIKEAIGRRGILKGLGAAMAAGAAGKASAIAGAFPTPSHQQAMYKAAADSNAAQARADAAAKAKADAARLQQGTGDIERLNKINYHGGKVTPTNAEWDGDGDFMYLDGTQYSMASRMPIKGDEPRDMKLISTKEGRQVYIWTRYRMKGDGGHYFYPAPSDSSQINEFAPGNGDDGLPYAEYQVYQCNPEDQFEWIGGPLYQTDSMGMAHKYAYEQYVKHRPKAFMVWQERSQGSRGNYGVKGQSDHDEDDLNEDYIDEK
jgi:hypothetical protein